MGTLTADSQRLPGYCEHKLPTSCRLTSVLNCCACADNRPHNPTYSTYVDGVGLVSRGTRWQRYCWFCKEFWSNRVAATNLAPTQTRIPERPDQTDFLAKWYDFHRGYRIVIKDDGTEERIAVLGEPLEDVAPGHLPRTLDELRNGHQRSTADHPQHIEATTTPDATGPSLDALLDNLIIEAQDDAAGTPANPISIRDSHSEPPAPRIAGNVMSAANETIDDHRRRRFSLLRDELARMRSSVESVIESLRDLGENVPESIDATAQLSALERSLRDVVMRNGHQESEAIPETSPRLQHGDGADIHQRISQAREQLVAAIARRHEANRRLADFERHHTRARSAADAAREAHSRARIRERQATTVLHRLRQDQRAAENFRRVFGSREDIEQADYESPIATMYGRAYGRYREAEAQRRAHGPPPAAEAAPQPIYRTTQQARPTIWVPQLPAPPFGSEAAFIDNSAPGPQYGTVLTPVEDYQSASDAVLGSTHTHSHPPAHAAASTYIGQPGDLAPVRWSENGPLPTERLQGIMQEYGRLPPPGQVERMMQEYLDGRGLTLDGTGGIVQARQRGLDLDPERPEPKSDEDLTVNLSCKICYTQQADIACLPCGHLVMCRWCSEQQGETAGDGVIPRRRDERCPLCRDRVRRKVKITIG